MNRILTSTLGLMVLVLFTCSCNRPDVKKKNPDSGKSVVASLVTVDPGHFHAALVQKSMYTDLSPEVHVYAPAGDDLKEHLARINAYNTRSSDPTRWHELVYTGEDFFERMLSDKAGNVVVLAGNNSKKAEYIERSIEAGLNVLADKPMIIRASDFNGLEKAFKMASEKHLVLFDIMTERYEIATIIQKALSQDSLVFGHLLNGTKDDPAVTKISVHHFAKIISGSPVKRPAWYFDTGQQGEGIVDVTTHLVDLVQWECFPSRILSPGDVRIENARRWTTHVSRDDFREVTGLKDFPRFLEKDIRDDVLHVYSNGEFTYSLNGIWARVSVEWKFRAPEGGGDTHYSVMKGSECNLVIRQAEAEKFVPTLYADYPDNKKTDIGMVHLQSALKNLPYEGISLERSGEREVKINIPAKYRVSHEEHFAQVMSKFLCYMKDGKIPDWEKAAMVTKYFTTTSALELALRN